MTCSPTTALIAMMNETVHQTVSAMRFIRVLMLNEVPEFMEFLGEDMKNQEVWNILKLMGMTIECDEFMPKWQEQNGIVELKMESGKFIAEHLVHIVFQDQASYAMFTLAHGDLSLDY